jgi:hypothetical protein
MRTSIIAAINDNVATSKASYNPSNTTSYKYKQSNNQTIAFTITITTRIAMVFIFATVDKHKNVLEVGVGPCQFCAASGSVDIWEHHSQTALFGIWNTKDIVHRMATCRKCARSVKEIYYTKREAPVLNNGNLKKNENNEDGGGNGASLPPVAVATVMVDASSSCDNKMESSS